MEGTNIVQKFVEIFPPVASALFTGREAWEVKGLVARPGSQGRDDVSYLMCHQDVTKSTIFVTPNTISPQDIK